MNPKTAHPLRKAAGAQTAQLDASLLAKTGRCDLAELRRLAPDSASVHEVKPLTRDQDALIQTQTRLVKQLTACLKDYSPAARHWFAQLQQRSTLVFLPASPPPQAAPAASLEEITATRRSGKQTHPTGVAPKILEELHRPQLLASPVIVRAKSRLMLWLVKQRVVVIQEIAGYDQAIRPLFLRHPDQEIWSSLPRAGKRLAPRRLSEWGQDRSRYADATSVQTLAGTAPGPFQSGNSAKAPNRFACVNPLRTVLHPFAWPSTRPEAWALADSQRKRAEGKTPSLAGRALANVWVRISSRLWVNQTSSQTATFEAAKLAPASRPHAA